MYKNRLFNKEITRRKRRMIRVRQGGEENKVVEKYVSDSKG